MGEGFPRTLRLRSFQKYEGLLRNSGTMQTLPQLVQYSIRHAEAETVLVSLDKIKKGVIPDEAYSFVSSIILRHNGNAESKQHLNAAFLINPP